MVDRQDAERGAEAADVGLPLAADIEQAGVEGDGHGEAGEHEVCGVVEGVADGEVIAKGAVEDDLHREHRRSEEHTSELQSLMRISYAVFCLKKKNKYKVK